ncbi:hypothetical protein [Paraburkholderia diazotrophica]|uniref:Uncharacterized protein n=1 Tax=Paraburkholderia diazotrophica TaxID=667676 RepID=A0A1H6W1K5_9BURK|nr:hypothetical protein [Paraburkholderia diazotrophica]SEJ07947.1 hypothetical protein SAMN05192539_1006197 [Paraburkholderia diazotrophica]
MTQPGWKYALLAIAVVSMSLGAACKKADNTSSDTGAAPGSSGAAPAAGAMGASGAMGGGAAGASGASQ